MLFVTDTGEVVNLGLVDTIEPTERDAMIYLSSGEATGISKEDFEAIKKYCAVDRHRLEEIARTQAARAAGSGLVVPVPVPGAIRR